MRLVPLFIGLTLGLSGLAWAEEDEAVVPLSPTLVAEENGAVDPESKALQPSSVPLEPEAALPAPFPVASDPEEPELFPGYLDCRRFTVDRVHCERLNRARSDIASLPLKTFNLSVGRLRETVAYREFAFRAFDPLTEEWHTILFGMPVAVKDVRFQPFILSAPDSSCQVKRLRGISLSRMVVEIRCHGHELLVYAGKHLNATRREEDREPGQPLPLRFEAAIYLSPPAHLARSEELAREGERVMYEVIAEASERLTTRRVRSRAFPEQLVAQVISPDTPVKLLLAEQWDLCAVPKRPEGCERFVPIPPYRDNDEVRRAILVELGMHGREAFRYAVSSAGARSAFQFMPGTYRLMVQAYPEAGLDPDYERGTADMVNHAMANLLLNDANLSHPRLQAWLRSTELADPIVRDLALGGAYNGGLRRGVGVAQAMEQFAREEKRSPTALTLQSLSRGLFEKYLRQTVIGLKRETQDYILKLIENGWFIRDRRGRQLPPASSQTQGEPQ